MSENKNNEVNNTKLVPAICTQCGGQLEVDPAQEAAVCPFCGTPFIVSKAINNYNTVHVHQNIQNNIRIQHGKRGIFESAAELIDRQLEREQNAAIRQQEIQLEREKLNMLKQQRKKEQSSKILKYIGYFFGWIYCFPIPLMLILKKKEDMDPKKKRQYIIIAWAVYVLFLAYAASTSGKGSAGSSISDSGSLKTAEISAGDYSVELPSGYSVSADKTGQITKDNYAAKVTFTEASFEMATMQKLLTDPSAAYSAFESNFSEITNLSSDKEEKNGLSMVKFYVQGTFKGDSVERQEYIAYITDQEKIYCLDLWTNATGSEGKDDFEAALSSLH